MYALTPICPLSVVDVASELPVSLKRLYSSVLWLVHVSRLTAMSGQSAIMSGTDHGFTDAVRVASTQPSATLFAGQDDEQTA